MSLENCSLCGMCRQSCPVFRAARSETATPRTKALMVKNCVSDRLIYACSLCKACVAACPAKVNLDEAMEKARKDLVKKGIETEANKRMIRNIREFGNPFGKVEKGSSPKELYCC